MYKKEWAPVFPSGTEKKLAGDGENSLDHHDPAPCQQNLAGEKRGCCWHILCLAVSRLGKRKRPLCSHWQGQSQP